MLHHQSFHDSSQSFSESSSESSSSSLVSKLLMHQHIHNAHSYTPFITEATLFQDRNNNERYFMKHPIKEREPLCFQNLSLHISWLIIPSEKVLLIICKSITRMQSIRRTPSPAINDEHTVPAINGENTIPISKFKSKINLQHFNSVTCLVDHSRLTETRTICRSSY